MSEQFLGKIYGTNSVATELFHCISLLVVIQFGPSSVLHADWFRCLCGWSLAARQPVRYTTLLCNKTHRPTQPPILSGTGNGYQLVQ